MKSGLYALTVTSIAIGASLLRPWISPAEAGPGEKPGRASTLISAQKNAMPFWNQRIEYDWQVRKDVASPTYTIAPGSHVDVQFTVQAVRTILEIQNVTWVTGRICVTNDGNGPTENLSIIDHIQKREEGNWVNLPSASETITPPDPIGAGEIGRAHV